MSRRTRLLCALLVAAGAAISWIQFVVWSGRAGNFRAAYYPILQAAESFRLHKGRWPTDEAELWEAMPEHLRIGTKQVLAVGKITYTFTPTGRDTCSFRFEGDYRGRFEREITATFPPSH